MQSSLDFPFLINCNEPLSQLCSCVIRYFGNNRIVYVALAEKVRFTGHRVDLSEIAVGILFSLIKIRDTQLRIFFFGVGTFL